MSWKKKHYLQTHFYIFRRCNRILGERRTGNHILVGVEIRPIVMEKKKKVQRNRRAHDFYHETKCNHAGATTPARFARILI